MGIEEERSRGEGKEGGGGGGRCGLSSGFVYARVRIAVLIYYHNNTLPYQMTAAADMYSYIGT